MTPASSNLTEFALAWTCRPTDSLILTVLGVLVFIFLSGWYSGMETGIYRFNRLRGRLMGRSGDHGARKLDQLLNNQRLLICVVLVGTNLTSYLATYILAAYCSTQGLSANRAALLTTLILTPTVFIFGDTVPKVWFYTRPNVLMLRSQTMFRISTWIVRYSGIGALLGLFSSVFLRLAQKLGPQKALASNDDDELAAMLRESHAAGAISSVQSTMAERVLELPGIRIPRVMIPISRVIALPIDASREDFIRTMETNPISRILLYDKQPSNIVGLVNSDRLIAESQLQPKDLLSPLMKLSSNTSLLDALVKLRTQSARVALVTGRQNQILGIVTMGHLVKHLLGD